MSESKNRYTLEEMTNLEKVKSGGKEAFSKVFRSEKRQLYALLCNNEKTEFENIFGVMLQANPHDSDCGKLYEDLLLMKHIKESKPYWGIGLIAHSIDNRYAHKSLADEVKSEVDELHKVHTAYLLAKPEGMSIKDGLHGRCLKPGEYHKTNGKTRTDSPEHVTAAKEEHRRYSN